VKSRGQAVTKTWFLFLTAVDVRRGHPKTQARVRQSSRCRGKTDVDVRLDRPKHFAHICLCLRRHNVAFRANCGIFYFANSPKFEQNDLLLSTEGVSLVDTWTASSIIRFTNIPIYNLARLLEESASHTALAAADPITQSHRCRSLHPGDELMFLTVLPIHFCSAVIKLYLSYR
jgi:hypothetical protein